MNDRLYVINCGKFFQWGINCGNFFKDPPSNVIFLNKLSGNVMRRIASHCWNILLKIYSTKTFDRYKYAVETPNNCKKKLEFLANVVNSSED